MRKQIVITPDPNTSASTWGEVFKLMNKQFLAGYPIMIPPNWKCEVVEVSEPIMVMKGGE